MNHWTPKLFEKCQYNSISDTWLNAEVIEIKEKADDSRIYNIRFTFKGTGRVQDRWVCIQQLRPSEIKDYTPIIHRGDKELLDFLENDRHLIAIKATVGGWVFERSSGMNTRVNNGNAGLRDAIKQAILR